MSMLPACEAQHASSEVYDAACIHAIGPLCLGEFWRSMRCLDVLSSLNTCRSCLPMAIVLYPCRVPSYHSLCGSIRQAQAIL